MDSKKPRKQRKNRYIAPIHKVKKYLKVHISKKLKEQLKTSKRSLLIKKGDTVKILVGQNKGKTAKVASVSYVNSKVYLEGMSRKNSRGNESKIPFEPSNLELVEIIDKNKRKI